MAKIYDSFSDLIGNTPFLELHNYRRARKLDARSFAKIEYFNPAGSVKDRIAWGIIKEAEEAGKIHPGDLLVDVTSGNTGIGIAAVAASRTCILQRAFWSDTGRPALGHDCRTNPHFSQWL